MELKDGDRVTCKIRGKQVDDAVITFADEMYYICQNIRDGARCADRKGYKYSWNIDSGSSEDFEGYGVTDLKVINTPKYKVGDILIEEGGDECMVLEVLTQCFLRSTWNNFERISEWVTFKAVEAYGWTLKQPEPEVVEVLGKKYDKDLLSERLKELKSLD